MFNNSARQVVIKEFKIAIMTSSPEFRDTLIYYLANIKNGVTYKSVSDTCGYTLSHATLKKKFIKQVLDSSKHCKFTDSSFHFNGDKQKSYINSFAWTNILLTFLQDILDPPLFPRLLNEDNKREITIKVGGGKGKGETKELKDEIPFQNTKKFDVFDYPENNLQEIKDKFYGIKKNGEKNKGLKGKNQMTVSEIFLKFSQFIGYYFNYRYTIVNSCYECQSFMPKVLKNTLKDDNTKYFFKKCNENDDLLLIREPFDYTYNPCKTVSKDKLEEIKSIFRDIYINILEKGEI